MTKLRLVYTYWRNRARTKHRAGRAVPELERLVKAAAQQYHETMCKQKKAHWMTSSKMM